MITVVIPQEDVNSETATVVEWHAAHGQRVQRGAVLLTVETTKAVFDVEAPADGWLIPLVEPGAQVAFNVPVAYLAATEEELRGWQETQSDSPSPPSTAESGPRRATRKARQLALQYGVDLQSIDKDGIITEKDVYQHLAALGILTGDEDAVITEAGRLPQGLTRVLIIGAGLGAMQVADILLNDPHKIIAGFVDDDPSLRGQTILHWPVLGTSAELGALWDRKAFDAAIVSISTNIEARARLFEACRELGIPMVNAIDPTVRINRFSRIGVGNVLCSFVHVGTCTVIGDNNFISSHSSIEHHNVWGSHITTGPGCHTSSRVKVGDRVKMGTGVFIQPGLAIGEGCQIASGAIIIRSIPPHHAVKTRVTTEIVPLRG
ncbi:MAG: hypothetical protein Kow0047_13740 [Anaerolineae bacterium]